MDASCGGAGGMGHVTGSGSCGCIMWLVVVRGGSCS